MNHDTPSPGPPRPLRHLSDVQRRVLTTAQLRAHGVSPAETNEQCRPGGPWQRILPGVHLLHPGAPTSEERLHAVLLYAARPVPAAGVPVQPREGRPHRPVYREAMITGLAALTLHGFGSAPALPSLDHIDVLVPRLRRLRSAGCAHVLRAPVLPDPEEVTGVPVAPVPRALADAVARLTDAADVRRLLSEAVRGGHCEPSSVVRELSQAKLLGWPHVVDAVDALSAEGRMLAEDRLYAMVREHGLPDPVWNVDLRLPGGPHLGGVDAFWPEQAVAVELDTRAPRPEEGDAGRPDRKDRSGRQDRQQEEDALWSEYVRKRELLERLGITVVHITPRKLREGMGQQAAVVRTALMAAGDHDPAANVVVLPR